MTNSVVGRFTLLIFLAAAPLVAQNNSTSRSKASSPTVIPLHRGPGLLRTIRVRVGRDTADFLFDTGGGVTVISPEDSATLGCTPGGKMFGVRLTGETISGRTCANVTLGVGPFETTSDVGVIDMARFLGGTGLKVRGLISLQSFRGRLLTMDLEHDRLIVETPNSLGARIRDMKPVEFRLATGSSGGQLDPFVGVRAPSGVYFWLELDSENLGETLLAPYVIPMFGGDSTAQTSQVRFPLGDGPGVSETVTANKGMIHDGVLSARFVGRAVWTLDLDRGRLWVSRFGAAP